MRKLLLAAALLLMPSAGYTQTIVAGDGYRDSLSVYTSSAQNLNVFLQWASYPEGVDEFIIEVHEFTYMPAFPGLPPYTDRIVSSSRVHKNNLQTNAAGQPFYVGGMEYQSYSVDGSKTYYVLVKYVIPANLLYPEGYSEGNSTPLFSLVLKPPM